VQTSIPPESDCDCAKIVECWCLGVLVSLCLPSSVHSLKASALTTPTSCPTTLHTSKNFPHQHVKLNLNITHTPPKSINHVTKTLRQRVYKLLNPTSNSNTTHNCSCRRRKHSDHSNCFAPRTTGFGMGYQSQEPRHPTHALWRMHQVR
jgi:hypothetical protein